MTKSTENSAADFIVPLDINGLSGRMMRMPAINTKAKNREILVVYGHHSSIERWLGLLEVLSGFGTVTLPDLPGFGGMDSFYKIGKKPTLDNMADYLASFIKLRYKHKRVTIVGMSFGFVIATRMLQRYPELTKNIDMIVSLVGFADSDDFDISRAKHWSFQYFSKLLSLRPLPIVFRYVALQPFVLRFVYTRTGHRKFADLEPEKIDDMVKAEIKLWHQNDVRTWLFTTSEFMDFSNCAKHVDLTIWHVGVREDHFFDNNRVEQHLRVIFNDFVGMTIDMTKHAPTVVATAEEAAPFIPPKLRRELSKLK